MPLPFDLDNVFAYKTEKIVRIRDRRLGISKLLITIAILVYVIIYEAIIQQGYLLKESPQGVVQTTLRRPMEDIPPEVPSYCADNAQTVPEGDQLPCQWLDEVDVWQPIDNEYGSMFISTRISYVTTTPDPNCEKPLYERAAVGGAPQLRGLDGSLCAKRPTVVEDVKSQDQHRYIGEVERFTMMWAHAVYGPISKTVKHNTELKFGEVEMHTETDLSFDENDREHSNTVQLLQERGYVGTKRGDILSIATMMRGAQLATLDQPSEYSAASCSEPTAAGLAASECETGCHWSGPRCGDETTQASCVAISACRWEAGDVCRPAADQRANLCKRNSIRYDGGVFLVMIDYQTPKLTIDDMGYEYDVRYIPKAEYQVILKTRMPDGTIRWENRHGLRILLVQTGFMTRFSFLELLKTLVAGFALFTVADVLIEHILMRVLPRKHVYEHYKFTTSEDFSVVNVSADDPLGGLKADDFVYGINRPGGEVMLEAVSKDSDDGLDSKKGRAPEKEEEKEKEKETEPTHEATV